MIILHLQCRDFIYERYCKAFKALFSEVISVLCFGQGSYEPPQHDLTVYLMERIFHRDRTQEMTALSWEQADDEPVVRSLLLQIILSGRYVYIGELLISL